MPFDTLAETRIALQELHREYGELGERMGVVIQRASAAELEVDKLKMKLQISQRLLREILENDKKTVEELKQSIPDYNKSKWFAELQSRIEEALQ